MHNRTEHIGAFFVVMLAVWAAGWGCDPQDASAESPERQQADEVQMVTTSFEVDGMSCVSCAAAIEERLDDADGIIEGDVDFGERRADVEYDPQVLDEADIVELIDEEGFTAEPAGGES